ncbi:MAG: class I SAM-dependent methyltransferase [Nannocystaceae bacterium]
MAQSERERWNAKYREGEHGRTEPSAAVTELSRWLPASGRALDVAGGTGAHARWLARAGLEVTLADVSEVGLALAVERAVLDGVDLRVAQVDLEHDPLPPGPWDLVLCSNYLQRSLVPLIAAALRPGGRLLWVHPITSNLQRHAMPSARFLLEPGEAERLVGEAGLDVRWSEEGWVGQGPTARCLARVVAERPAPGQTPG